MICDFCSSTFVAWIYPCASFEVSQTFDGDTLEPMILTQQSSGNWLACEICSELIEKERYDRLLLRSYTAFIFINHIEAWPIFEHFKKLHTNFKTHRTGPRMHYNPQEENRGN